MQSSSVLLLHSLDPSRTPKTAPQPDNQGLEVNADLQEQD